LKAHIPLLLHPNPADVAIIGLGLGITLASTTNFPTVEKIRLVELSPEMVRAHDYLGDLTGNVLDDQKVQLRIDDGRNFMAMSDENFDVITADPVHPRISGVGYLYTQEYYETIRARLRPGGVVAQWMPMYNISPESFDAAFRTFAGVFPYASFWYVRGHGLFVAGDDPIKFSCGRAGDAFGVSAIASDFTSIGVHSPENLAGFLLMDRAHITQYLKRNQNDQIVTDDNAYLEYKTPFEFMGRTDAIVPELIANAGWSDEVFEEDCDLAFRAKARAAFSNRLQNILPELAEPIR
jgi:spermidine synthase